MKTDIGKRAVQLGTLDWPQRIQILEVDQSKKTCTMLSIAKHEKTKE